MDQPPQPKYLEISPQDQAKVDKAKRLAESLSITPEWMFVARFGKHYGFAGVEAILQNKISLDEADVLLRAADKLDSNRLLDNANISFAANVSSRNKKGIRVLHDMLKNYIRDAKAN